MPKGRATLEDDGHCLGFREEVFSAFRFLTDEYGFQIRRAAGNHVRYESSQVLVELWYDFGRSYEVELWMGTSKRSKFSLGDILSVLAEEFSERCLFQMSTETRLRENLPKIAGLLRQHCDGGLRGDAAFYQRIRDHSGRQAARLRLELSMGNWREKLRSAWHSRDYEGAVVLLERASAMLTEAERRKLAYARKKLAAGKGHND